MHYGDIATAQAVTQAGVSLSDNDIVTPSLGTKITADMGDIKIGRKYHVMITADGKTTAAVVTEGSVENALTQAGVTLGSDDTVSADKTAAITEGMKITVARVSYQEVTTTDRCL